MDVDERSAFSFFACITMLKKRRKERKKPKHSLATSSQLGLSFKCHRESLDTKQAGEGCSGKGDLPTSRPGRSWEEEGGCRGFVLVFISSNEMCSMNTDQGCVSPSRSKGTKHCCDKAQHTTDLLFFGLYFTVRAGKTTIGMNRSQHHNLCV